MRLEKGAEIMVESVQVPITRPCFDSEELKEMEKILASGWVTQGKETEAFERAVADYVGAPFAVATSSCSTALELTLRVAGIGEGDEVVMPSFTFIATANAVRHVGAFPVFAEIDHRTYNILPNDAEKKISSRTKAVIAVHQFGLPAEVDTLLRICERKRILFIQDAACALGSVYRGKRLGELGPVACFSFHPRKVITTGEGGMLVTHEREWAEKARRLRSHGASLSDLNRHEASEIVFEAYPEVGYNFRMTDLQAAVGVAQLKKMPWVLDRRKEFAHRYNNAFRSIACLEQPLCPEGVDTNYQSYCLRVKEDAPFTRNQLMGFLLKRGVASRRGCQAVHQESAYKEFHRAYQLPETDRAVEQTILLPLYPGMSNEEQDKVIRAVGDLAMRK